MSGVAYMPEPVNAWDGVPPPEHYYWDQIEDRVYLDEGAVLWTWTVYHGTIDAPSGWYVVRPFLVARGGDEPVPYVGYMAPTLERARKPLEMMGLALILADENDPKEIVESWI